MHDFFEAIDFEKQQRIINAALKEFALHGFKKASTNRIVEAAEISKGMLFYYFHNKQELYKFLLDYSMETVKKYFSKTKDSTNKSDFLEIYRTASKIELEMYLENPCVFDFLVKLYLHSDEANQNDDLKKTLDELNDMRKKYLDNYDLNQSSSKFRSDIPSEKLEKYIKWLIDGYLQDTVSRLEADKLVSEIDPNVYWTEYYEMLDDLKIIFYKEGASE